MVAAGAPGAPIGESVSSPETCSKLNGVPILSLVELQARVDALATGRPVVSQEERSGELVYVPFRL